MVEIQTKRYFEENSSKEEIEVLKNRVDYYDNDTIWFRDIPIPSSFVQNLFFEKLNEIIKPGQKFYMLVDLRDVIIKKADVENRAILKNTIEHYKSQIIHGCVVVGTNIFMKVAAKVVFRGRIESLSFHPNMEEALVKMTEIRK